MLALTWIVILTHKIELRNDGTCKQTNIPHSAVLLNVTLTQAHPNNIYCKTGIFAVTKFRYVCTHKRVD